MSDIQELDQSTVDRIAAGEVVERPAAAVKELVENSLDAEAESVTVELEAGGTERITVRDDGHGMAESDLRLAIRQHTTSKIHALSDLERIATLGFRGEALHAIAAVSRMTISSRHADEDRGTAIEIEGGEVRSVEPVGRPVGTTVTVTDLFYNVPARRKHLATESTEFGHCNRVVSRYALGDAGVAMALHHDDREVFATPGRGNLREAALAVLGAEVAESLVDIGADDETLADIPIEGLRGVVSHPETTRSTREYMSTYVNGRYVENGPLREAILEGYGAQLAADRFPFTAVFVTVDPGAVDVNIHPRKLRVRFGDASAITAAVEAAVRSGLEAANLVRSGAPRGRSAPTDADISQQSLEDGPTRHNDPSSPSSSEHTPPSVSSGTQSDAPDRQGEGVALPGEVDARHRADSAPHETMGSGRRCAAREVATSEGGVESRNRTNRSGRVSAPTRHASLGDSTESDGPSTLETDRLPAMQLLGDLGDTYIVASTEDGLLLIDQHAADERIHYERFADRAAAEDTAQRLVDPVRIEVTAAEAAIFDSVVSALDDLGFETSRNGRIVTVRAVPSVLAAQLAPEHIVDVLAEVLANGQPSEVTAVAADHVLADLACHPAITANTRLHEGSTLALLSALDECENPYACPHGRPTLIRIGAEEIADRFERDYPGHQIRAPEDE